MFSGVAGAFKLGQLLPQAETAFLSARNTEIPSIKGGSPTAFDLKIVFSKFKLSNNLTLKIFGRSDAHGILYVDGA